MNCFLTSGRMITEPTSTFIRISNDKEIFIVKFCIATTADFMFLNAKEAEKTTKYDFFQCVAFEDVAKNIVTYFDRGTKITMQSMVKNFPFKDSNGTPHLTQILLLNQVEYDDNAAQSFKLAPRKKNMDKVMVSELERIDALYKKVCDEGFLCINESDYYNMAISNIVM